MLLNQGFRSVYKLWYFLSAELWYFLTVSFYRKGPPFGKNLKKNIFEQNIIIYTPIESPYKIIIKFNKGFRFILKFF
jgi:hypothetical protein